MRILVLGITLLAATGAHADATGSARTHWEEGTKLYDLGRYKDAAHEYEEAFRLKPDPAFLFNIGQAYRQAGEDELALRAYRGFLRRFPDTENRAEVEGYIHQVQARIDEAKRKAAEPAPAPVEKEKPAPEPAPNPVITPPTPAPIVVTPVAPPREHVPAYKKWWVWTIVGVVVVGGAAATLAVLYTTPKNAPAPAGTMTLVFP